MPLFLLLLFLPPSSPPHPPSSSFCSASRFPEGQNPLRTSRCPSVPFSEIEIPSPPKIQLQTESNPNPTRIRPESDSNPLQLHRKFLHFCCIPLGISRLPICRPRLQLRNYAATSKKTPPHLHTAHTHTQKMRCPFFNRNFIIPPGFFIFFYIEILSSIAPIFSSFSFFGN